MKECPKCHTQYDDTMSFCTKDGCRLIEPGNATVAENNPPLRPKQKGGCLKKIVVSVVLLIIALVAFYNYIMNAATYLRVEPNMIKVVKAGGECKVDVDYDGYVWTINHKPDWVNIDERDEYFNITVMPNTTGQDRQGTITVQSGKRLAQMAIGQLGYATRLKTDEYSLNFSSSGGSQKLKLDTDGCALQKDCPDWISVDEEKDGTLSITCDENDDEYRTGTIVLSEDNVSQSVFVVQGGTCNVCHGEGDKTCSYCLGTGSSGFGWYSTTCMWCGGKGKLECSTCNGTGKRDE